MGAAELVEGFADVGLIEPGEDVESGKLRVVDGAGEVVAGKAVGEEGFEECGVLGGGEGGWGSFVEHGAKVRDLIGCVNRNYWSLLGGVWKWCWGDELRAGARSDGGLQRLMVRLSCGSVINVAMRPITQRRLVNRPGMRDHSTPSRAPSA